VDAITSQVLEEIGVMQGGLMPEAASGVLAQPAAAAVTESKEQDALAARLQAL
jgi:hypothetical protein